jgi:hypothetical protein
MVSNQDMRHTSWYCSLSKLDEHGVLWCAECSNHYVEKREVLTSLRTPLGKELTLDKEQATYDDLLDAI